MFKLALDAGHGLNTKGKQTPDGIPKSDVPSDQIFGVDDDHETT